MIGNPAYQRYNEHNGNRGKYKCIPDVGPQTVEYGDIAAQAESFLEAREITHLIKLVISTTICGRIPTKVTSITGNVARKRLNP